MSKITQHAESANHIAVFQESAIRRAWHGEEWWFSMIDVVSVLSESNNPNRYWSDLKRKLVQEAGSEQPYEKIVRLKLTALDGKQRDTDCANTEILFRVIQSIPSPRAEPFKRWLAQVGYERVKEIEKTRNSLVPAHASCIRPRGIRRHGSRSGCARLPCAAS